MTTPLSLTVLIGDDEELARRRLRRLLTDLNGSLAGDAEAQVEIVGECANGVEVLRRLAEGPVDVLLLDINMPGMSGMEAVKLLPEPRPYVVFCTAHAEHAVTAFEVGAVDYLLKPIDGERLELAIARARRNVLQARGSGSESSQREAQQQPRSGGALVRLPVATRAGIVLVDPNDIVSATLDGELVRLKTTKGELYSDESLQALLDQLSASAGVFERVHRRAVVNLAHVSRLEPLPTGGYLAHTTLGDSVEVSRQAARALRRRLGLRKPESDDG